MAVDELRPATLDTGALIALEDAVTGRGGSPTARTLLARMRQGLAVTVPTVVVAEWWRGQQGPAARLLTSVKPEATTLVAARAAGVLLSVMQRPQPAELLVVDAIVVVSAALRGDDIYTQDPDDIVALRDKYIELHRLARSAVRVYRI